MRSICPEINIAIKLAIDYGNEVKEKTEGWDKAKQVISMRNKIDAISKKLFARKALSTSKRKICNST